MFKLRLFLTEVATETTEKADFLSNEWVKENKYVLLFTGAAIVIGLGAVVVWKKVLKKHRGYRG